MWTIVEQLNARLMLDTATSAAAVTTLDRPLTERRRRLSLAALAVASQ
jgi:hypothetical protein